MPYAQLVVGPPGSGKTTYCRGMSQMLSAMGRKVALVNLDPANNFIPYECAINIAELITLDAATETHKLGPNGGMMFCMEFLEKNMDWLLGRLAEYKDHYFLFDCPGQVELFTHHHSMKNIIEVLQKEDFRLVAVHLVDAHYCADPAKYISVLLLSLKTMIQLELPHINVLSKVDLMEMYGKLQFNLDFYTEVMDLSYLLEHLNNDRFGRKFQKLNKALCDLIEDFSLVGFHTLCIEDKDSVVRLVRAVDKTGGYAFGSLEAGNENIFETAVQVGHGFEPDHVADVQEKYIDFPDVFRDHEVEELKKASAAAAALANPSQTNSLPGTTDSPLQQGR